jgi:hypothetical protein
LQLRQELLQGIAEQKPFEIGSQVSASSIAPMQINSNLGACLLPLWEGSQPLESLVERWLKIRPLDPATLEPIEAQVAFEQVTRLLCHLETFLYVLLERSPEAQSKNFLLEVI